ncbi:HvfC/BufC N-terminal domain-containing protein [Segnochrobactrum spirostomi]|uniref:DUF2063 domain-containing protein n=1 Tax=Segnochrobactrum spirostomi TaxID=2608987 RepID=A0A6A7XXM9_9HYPH|nr:DNA-binding domain-containing protein [Segnochrobactrum spirostomi]MQT11093.1 DUF2063 domain-containing protein [Segnochrobactrum spirostomi]
MSVLSQSAVYAAVRDPEAPVPAGFAGDAARRFAIYRNNVAVGWIGALEARFPAGRRIVGEDFFRAMAAAFVRVRPPRSRLLHTYGDDFPDFVEDFPPAAGVPYLADVMRLEAARTRAYHAADAAPLLPEALAAVAPEAAETLRFAAHPAAAIVASPHPIVRLWAMNVGDLACGPLDDWMPEAALVVRPGLEVEVHALEAGAAAFALALLAGVPLTAAAASPDGAPAFDLAATLGLLIGAGAFARATDLSPSSSEDDHADR